MGNNKLIPEKWKLIVILLFAGWQCMAQGQTHTGTGWQNAVLGNWKVDSIILGNKPMAEGERADMEQHKNYISFFADNSFIAFSDSTLFYKDSFLAIESGKKKLLYNKVLYVEVKEIQANRMILWMTQPGMKYSRRGLATCYLTKTTAAINKPKVVGDWFGKPDYSNGYNADISKNSIDLEKNGFVKVTKYGVADSGTWVLDPDKFVINMKLTRGRVSSAIMILERNSMTITDPFYKDSLLDFERSGNDYRDMAIADSTAMALKNDSMIAVTRYSNAMRNKNSDSIPPTAILRKWQATKIVRGRDSIETGKTISVLFLNDNKFTITINNKKTSSTWTINTTDNIIVFNIKGKEVLCRYFMDYHYENYNPGPTSLTMIMQMPGEKKIETYYFK